MLMRCPDGVTTVLSMITRGVMRAAPAETTTVSSLHDDTPATTATAAAVRQKYRSNALRN